MDAVISQHVFQPFLQQWSTNDPIEMEVILKLFQTAYPKIYTDVPF